MSRRVSPHVNTIFEIDYTRVAQVRARKKKEYAERGVNLTYLAFIAKAVADRLRKHPVVNAAVRGESTILRRDINLGIAVALDWGLIVPVIRHADELSLLGLARAINDLGERARTKKLSPDEVQKGTFTITNPGVFGSVIGTPIINQPQAAILCVGVDREAAGRHHRGRDRHARHPDPGHALARVRSPDRGRRRRRPVHGRREDDAPGVPGRRGLRCPHAHRVAGEGAAGARQRSTWRRCGSWRPCAEARGWHLWVFRRTGRSGARSSSAAKAGGRSAPRPWPRRPADERRLEARIRAVASYEPGAWDLWEEVRS